MALKTVVRKNGTNVTIKINIARQSWRQNESNSNRQTNRTQNMGPSESKVCHDDGVRTMGNTGTSKKGNQQL